MKAPEVESNLLRGAFAMGLVSSSPVCKGQYQLVLWECAHAFEGVRYRLRM